LARANDLILVFPIFLSRMHRLRLTVQQSGFIPASRVASGVLAVIAMLIPAMIQAQSSSASATLQGAVRDSKARPVAGATVYLQVKDGAETVSTHSDAAGNYRFAGLREGVYMLRVEAQGHGQSTFGPCVLGPKEAKQLDLTLEVGGAPEFFDEPQFTVAGVTDGTNLGGHGSNAVVRTKESLARDIASLSAKPPSGSLPRSAADTNESSLRDG